MLSAVVKNMIGLPIQSALDYFKTEAKNVEIQKHKTLSDGHLLVKGTCPLLEEVHIFELIIDNGVVVNVFKMAT